MQRQFLRSAHPARDERESRQRNQNAEFGRPTTEFPRRRSQGSLAELSDRIPISKRPNFEVADIGVGSVVQCRYKPRRCPLNRPECRFNSLSEHRLIPRAMGELRPPIVGSSSRRANPTSTCEGHTHDSPAALRVAAPATPASPARIIYLLQVDSASVTHNPSLSNSTRTLAARTLPSSSLTEVTRIRNPLPSQIQSLPCHPVDVRS